MTTVHHLAYDPTVLSGLRSVTTLHRLHQRRRDGLPITSHVWVEGKSLKWMQVEAQN